MAKPNRPETGRRIVLVSNTSWYLLNFRAALIEELITHGWSVFTLAPDDQYGAELAALGSEFSVWHLNRRSVSPLGHTAAFLRLLSIYRRIRPHVVHHFTIKPIILGGIAARILGIPGIVQAVTGLGHAFSKESSLDRLALNGYRLALGGRAFTVFQNEDDMSQIIGSGVTNEDKCTLIRGSGVDVERFSAIPLPQSDGRITFLMACRMLWAKGVREYVEAARTLHESDPNLRFLLVGDSDRGSPDAVPHEWLEKLRGDGSVEWRGHQPDTRDSLAEAHVVVLPSYREGLPKSLLEGAAAGRPLVATDVPGCRDVTLEGRSGILVKARDAAALAAGMLVLTRDPIARRTLGEGAKALVHKRFASEIIIGETLELYERILSKPPNSTKPHWKHRTGATSGAECAEKR